MVGVADFASTVLRRGLFGHPTHPPTHPLGEHDLNGFVMKIFTCGDQKNFSKGVMCRSDTRFLCTATDPIHPPALDVVEDDGDDDDDVVYDEPNAPPTKARRATHLLA